MKKALSSVARLGLLVCTLAAFTRVAPAQLVAGVNAAALSVTGDSTSRGIGAVAGLMLGMGVTPRTLFYFDVDVGAVHAGTTRMIAHADLMGRFYPARQQRWRPYAEVGFAARGIQLSDDRDLLGTGLALAAGAEIPIRTARRLDIALVVWRGFEDEVRRDGHTIASGLRTNSTSLRLRIGYHLRAPS